MAAESATEDHLAPGTNLNGTYEIVQRLFEGGMADIYEARHVRLTGQYAVKVLRHSLTAQHASAFDRFRREAEVTSSLRHPHIVQVLDFNQTAKGATYFVMELLEGQNLGQHLAAHGALPLPDVAIIVDQVASALGAAHARGIVHRDLKPENIHMLPLAGRKEPFVKVLDFGISKVLAASTLTQETMLVGTPHYMAPEQARGASEDLDGRTDEFALGAIAHELLTGRRLFEAESVFTILYKVLNDDPPSLAPIASEEVDAIIRKALAKDREDRYPTVAAFAEALRDAVFGPPRGSAVSMPTASGRVAMASPRSGAGGAVPATGAVSPGVAVTPSATTSPDASRGGRSRRGLVVAVGALVLAAGAAGLLWTRQAGPTWTTANGQAAVAAGAEVQANLRRLLAGESAALADKATRAGKVPNLANAIVGRIDDATFQDILANEIWWSDYRAFGAVVLVGDIVKVAWQLPSQGVSAAQLGQALGPGGAGDVGGSGGDVAGGGGAVATRATLVTGSAGTVMAAAAGIEGVKDGRIILVLPVDRPLVAQLASRANIVLMLSDGAKTLGTSVPENTIPEIEQLVGQESRGNKEGGILVDKQHQRLAAAVPWTNGLWLWGITGLAP